MRFIISLILFFCLVTKTLFAQQTDILLLTKKVAALTENSNEEKLKKATLKWALEEAILEEKADRIEEYKNLLIDVEQSLKIAIGNKLEAPKNLFPTIPQFDKNPIAKAALVKVEKIIMLGISKDDNDPLNNPQNVSDYNNKLGPTALLLVQAFCHPQSPLNGDVRIIPILLHCFQTMYRGHMAGSKFLGDFGHAPIMAEMYLLLKTVYPSLILQSRKASWESSIKMNADAIMLLREKLFKDGKQGTAYPNADVKYINALLFSSMILNDNHYREAADNGEKLMSSAIYPDGGWAYIGEQNENYTYHSINITETCRYWQVTNSSVAWKNIEDSRWYLPLSIEPTGVAEYSTSPGWKHYWNQIKAPEAALMMASLLNDPQNMRIAKLEFPKPDFNLASYYKDNIIPATTPENYFVYDRNTLGPRGRFGNFSFNGTSRSTPHEDRGKSTYAGCMLMYPEGKIPQGISAAYPLQVALNTAGTDVYLKPSKEDKPLRLSRNETNAVIVSKDVALVSTVHTISPYHGKPSNFTGQQIWLFTKERLIGLVIAVSNKDQDVFGVNGSINFLFNQAKNQPQEKIKQLNELSFQYGNLITTIIENNYSKAVIEYPSERENNGSIVLYDAKATDTSLSSPLHYTTNETHFYLTEIRPENYAPTTIKRMQLPNGLIGFEVTENKKSYWAIANPTTNNQTLDFEWPKNSKELLLHRSGEEYRPSWIGKDDKEEWKNKGELVTKTKMPKILVPAGAHILLTN